jgi:hypothetical protein
MVTFTPSLPGSSVQTAIINYMVASGEAAPLSWQETV